MNKVDKLNINPKIFRAYDIRGKYPSEINEAVVKEIVYNFAKRKLQSAKRKLKIVVAYDARLSSSKLYRAAIETLQSANRKARIVKIGLATTPMFYFLVNHFNADAGIMITASHNPKEYNGLKIVGKNAVPISGEDVLKIMNNEL